ncbi:MAG: hypothetical protein V1775_06280 [Bacteroidota bacterium]
MAKNFTHKDLLHVPIKLKNGYSLYPIRTNPLNASPSEVTIRNILNYSKALSVVPDSLTGNFSLILLN